MQRREIRFPPDEVLTAFGIERTPVRLPGGQGQAFRAGDVILKPAADNERTNWIARFYANTPVPGFRLPKPMLTRHGEIVFRGWQAWVCIPGEHRHDGWEGIVDHCVAFHEAIADVPRPDWLDRLGEMDPWIIADRVAWSELSWNPHPRIAPVVQALTDCLRPIDVPSQLIHGDFGGNILLDEQLPPAIIDFSPYWRPLGFAVGVVVADAIVWEGADPVLIDAVRDIPAFDQLLARAELRRVLELDAAHRLWGWDTLDEIDAHRLLVQAIVNRCL